MPNNVFYAAIHIPTGKYLKRGMFGRCYDLTNTPKLYSKAINPKMGCYCCQNKPDIVKRVKIEITIKEL